jgi:hypothetical protein
LREGPKENWKKIQIDVANALAVCNRNSKQLKHRKAFPLASTQAGKQEELK